MTDTFTQLPPEDGQRVKASTVKLLLEGSGVGTLPHVQQEIQQRFGFEYATTTLTYPYRDYLRIVDYLAKTLYADTERENAYEAMGYKAITTFFSRPSGQVITLTAAMLGPKRSTSLFLKRLSLTLPWAEHTFEIEPGNAVRYHVERVGGPAALMRGVLRAAAEAAGAKNVRVTTTTRTETDRIYHITWT